MNMAFDWSIRLGDVVTILSFGAMAVAFLYTLKGEVRALGDRVHHIEKDLGTFVQTLVAIGQQGERLNSHAHRITELEKAAPRTKRR